MQAPKKKAKSGLSLKRKADTSRNAAVSGRLEVVGVDAHTEESNSYKFPPHYLKLLKELPRTHPQLPLSKLALRDDTGTSSVIHPDSSDDDNDVIVQTHRSWTPFPPPDVHRLCKQPPSMLNWDFDTDKQAPSMLNWDFDTDKQAPSMLHVISDADEQAPSMLISDADEQGSSMFNNDVGSHTGPEQFYLSPTEPEAEEQLFFSDHWDTVPDDSSQLQSNVRPSTSGDQPPVSAPDDSNTQLGTAREQPKPLPQNEPIVIEDEDEQVDNYEIDDFNDSFENKDDMDRFLADVDLYIEQSPDSSSSDELPCVDWTGTLSQNKQPNKAKSGGKWQPVIDKGASINTFGGFSSTPNTQANSHANIKSLHTSPSTLQASSARTVQSHLSDSSQSYEQLCSERRDTEDARMETNQVIDPQESSSAMPSCPLCSFRYPDGFTQIQADEHLALCLSLEDMTD